MAEKVSILAAFDIDAIKTLKKEGVLTKHESFNSIPLPFKDVIHDYMVDYIGFDTGPIYSLARINGNPVSLKDTAFKGDLTVVDILPIRPGEVIFELSVPLDTIVSLGMNKLSELVDLSKQFGEDNDIVLDMLRTSLAVGSISSDEENVFCFTPRVRKEDCEWFVKVGEDWDINFGDINSIEAVTVSSLAKF